MRSSPLYILARRSSKSVISAGPSVRVYVEDRLDKQVTAGVFQLSAVATASLMTLPACTSNRQGSTDRHRVPIPIPDLPIVSYTAKWRCSVRRSMSVRLRPAYSCNAIMDDPVFLCIDGIIVTGWTGGLETAALIDRNVDDDRFREHCLDQRFRSRPLGWQPPELIRIQ